MVARSTVSGPADLPAECHHTTTDAITKRTTPVAHCSITKYCCSIPTLHLLSPHATAHGQHGKGSKPHPYPPHPIPPTHVHTLWHASTVTQPRGTTQMSAKGACNTPHALLQRRTEEGTPRRRLRADARQHPTTATASTTPSPHRPALPTSTPHSAATAGVTTGTVTRKWGETDAGGAAESPLQTQQLMARRP